MCLQRSKLQPQCNMEDLKNRLTRSLSVPRRCSICRKTLYFSVAKCQECGSIVHKHCNHHKHSHQNNLSDNIATHNMYKTDTGILGPINQNRGYQYRSVSESSYDSDSRFRHVQHGSIPADTPGIAMAGLLKIVRWLSHRRKTKELSCKANAMAAEKHVRGRFGLNPKLDDKETRKKLKALLKSTQNYQKQITQPQSKQRCSSVRTASTSSSKSSKRLCRSLAIRSDSTMPSSPLSSVSSYAEFASPFDTPKSRHEEILNRHYQNKEQTSTKTPFLNFVNRQKNLCFKNGANIVPSDREQNFEKVDGSSLPEMIGWTFGVETRLSETKPESSPDVATAALKFSKPPTIVKAKTLSIEKQNFSNESLCATWPPAGKGDPTIDEVSEDGEYTEDEVDENLDLKTDYPRTEEALKEWCIPFGDIEFGEKIRHGRKGDIYRGRWYGEVLIYTIRNSCESELHQFLKDVSQMGMIRHENIVLFMGACIEPSKLAVITSMRKGPTLYDYLHLKRHRLPFHSKLNIARQIAQGIGYLHAKEITHRKLNSKNIILESRVKLCMMDHGMSDKNYDRNDYGCIPRGQLSYLSPELIRTLRIQPPGIFPTAIHTQKSDIFAFGSLLFELLAERFAFHDHHPHAIIYQIANGKRYSLENFQFITGLKSLIKKCWSQNAFDRPPFSEIVITLQENVTHHKRHSSSVPDKLHCTGRSLRRSICT